MKLDGEEVELCFIDHPSNEMSVENTLTTYDPHAFIVVYSVDDHESFLAACDTLQYLTSQSCNSRCRYENGISLLLCIVNSSLKKT